MVSQHIMTVLLFNVAHGRALCWFDCKLSRWPAEKPWLSVVTGAGFVFLTRVLFTAKLCIPSRFFLRPTQIHLTTAVRACFIETLWKNDLNP